jgi:DNA invertase Pin-like site-specific DNA recombinase
MGPKRNPSGIYQTGSKGWQQRLKGMDQEQRERIRRGMAQAKSKGQHVGRKRIELDLDAIHGRIESSESIRAVAKDLKVSHTMLAKRMAAYRKFLKDF